MTATVGVPRPDLSHRPLAVGVTRTMRAPPDVLYRAWTVEFDRWFATPGTVTMRAEAGVPFFFETTFESTRHPHYGRFLELVPHSKVVITWVTEATLGVETVVSVDLAAQAKGTRLALTHSGFADEASKEKHEFAWPTVLDHLDQIVDGKARPRRE